MVTIFAKAEDSTLTCGILGGESRKVNGGGLFGCVPNNGGGDGVKSGRRGGGEGLASRRPLFPVRDCITPISFIFSTGFNRERSWSTAIDLSVWPDTISLKFLLRTIIYGP